MNDDAPVSVEDSRWEVNTSHPSIGMPCTATRNDGTEQEGQIAAVWLFRRRRDTDRRRRRRRSPRQRREGPRLLRETHVTGPQTLITPATEAWKQVGQKQLRAQLRSNPLRDGEKTWPVDPRRGARTTGLLRGWLKRLVVSSGLGSGRAITSHGTFGCRCRRDTTRMQDTHRLTESHRTSQPAAPTIRGRFNATSCGTTHSTVEEERVKESAPSLHSRYQDEGITAPCGGFIAREGVTVPARAFNTTTNWYHSVTIPSPSLTGNGEGGTSVVPLLSSRGVLA